MTVPHFSLAYWCILIAVLLPIICSSIAKSGMLGKSRHEGGMDNKNPRAWLAQQTAWRASANAAQANSFEALPFFIGAVIIAHQLGAPQGWLDLLAVLFVFLRVIFVLLYLGGQATARSLVWTLAFAVNIGILFLGYR